MSRFPLQYRYKIKERPKTGDWVVQMFKGYRLEKVFHFTACNAALSFVERREAFILGHDKKRHITV